MGKSILLTGFSGYIGSHLVLRPFWGIDSVSSCMLLDLKCGHDFSELKNKEFDAAIHLAAHASVTQSLINPDECLDNNAFKLIPFLMNNKIGKLIFTSTGGAIYGEKHFAKEEDASWSGCISPYGQSKYLAEQIIRRLQPNHIILRLGNVYGGNDADRLELAAHARFRTDSPIVVYGGEQTRDFVHVDVVCEAILRAIRTDVTGTFNIGSGVETRVSDIAESFSRERDTPIIYKSARPGEINHVSLDITKARQAGLL